MKHIPSLLKLRKQAVLGVSSLGLLLATFASLLPLSASAAGGNGLRISPVRSDLTINPGSSQTVTVNVTNVTAIPATFQTIVNDFTASPDESGNPAIILNPGQYAASHSLKRLVGPTGNNFTLGPGQAKAVPITINVPKNAVGGGYYGAVRFAPASSSAGPGQNVSLAGSVGSLILVKVPGNITEKVTIASFDTRKNDNPSSFFTNTKNVNAVVRFQNQGNIQEAPFGKLQLKNRSGKVLATYELNNVTPPSNVLPDSIRKFPIDISKKVHGFGKYRLEGNFGYGSAGQLLSGSTTFYVVPSIVIIIFVLVVLLLIFLIFVLPRLVSAYNRRVLSRAGRVMSKSRR